jgi:peptidylprolyl isomerase
VVGNYVAYDWAGKTSKLLGSTFTQGSPSLFVGGQMITGVQKALVGQKIGSRVLAVVPPADGLGAQATSAGIGTSDTLVFVIDLNSEFSLVSVPGKQTASGGGLPAVVAPASSTAGPTVNINTKATPPKDLQVKTVIKGAGPVVKKGDNIVVNYNGYIWRTGKSFQSSWSHPNQPYQTPIGEGAVIKGWDTGLVGQTMGSRVLLVIPPAQGYGSAGSSQAGIKGTDTLVFVVDILAASSNPSPVAGAALPAGLRGEQGRRVPAGGRRRQEVRVVLIQGAAHGRQADGGGAEGFVQPVAGDRDQAVARRQGRHGGRHPRRLRFREGRDDHVGRGQGDPAVGGQAVVRDPLVAFARVGE